MLDNNKQRFREKNVARTVAEKTSFFSQETDTARTKCIFSERVAAGFSRCEAFLLQLLPELGQLGLDVAQRLDFLRQINLTKDDAAARVGWPSHTSMIEVLAVEIPGCWSSLCSSN